MMVRRRLWTPEEDAKLLENYPIRGASWDGWERLLPDRTTLAIKQRVVYLRRAGVVIGVPSRLGMKRDVANWTISESMSLLKAVSRVSKSTGHTVSECIAELMRLQDEARSNGN